MATNTVARGTSRKAARIPVRKITHEDLSLSLRQGLEDFLTFRGDIVGRQLNTQLPLTVRKPSGASAHLPPS